ncbi:MAG: glutathione S-transferase family protein [Hyphomicrobiales bacterium]|uniref:glutathione S-transferase family protein n=1 Tax=Rhabdaerophilum calidifontis TaxID=2604328 RepID=UPI0012392A8B|nr:glutathione S-transferase family protein [Rhabdaerophilum calidifontis]MCA1952414.1 glutathione S-transferase family protein [Hyphomicrobiales bacterium]MCA1998688.1 glutathione S-transferase family protein [Hyphomicrobiales bacterium]
MAITTNVGAAEPKFPPKLTLVIGNKNYSSWSLRPWLAMAARGVPFAEILIPLEQPNTRQQVLQYSPSGLVPALKFGNLLLWESLAIIEYVADKHPEAQFWPEEPEFRALARCLSAEIHSGFQALRAHCPMNLRRRAARRLTPQVEADVMRLSNYVRHFRAMAPEGEFLFGAFGAVDAMMAPLATRIRSYEIPVDRATANYVDAIHALPAFQKWHQAAIAEPWRIPSTDNIDKLRP